MPAFLALTCVSFTAPALAEEGVVQSNVARDAEGQSIIVTGALEAKELESPKAVQSLLDTPQTVTVISDQTIRKQNLLTLRDALSTIPGITFGAGEGGGGYGDSINLRGFAASNDITQDGVRDSAQYSRTDPFNLQQIEVFNGANSVFNGSGSVGGTVNIVSKVPQADDLTIVQAGVGTDNYWRGTVDSNMRVNDFVAFRLNAMAHRNDIPGRDVEKNKRWGLAPAVTLGIGTPTSLTLAYLHQEDDNIPVYGVPYFKNQLNDGPLEEADDSDYFGYRNLDDQNIVVDRLTATFEHDFSKSLSLRNLTRWQRVGQRSVTSSPQGTFCLEATGLQPVSAGPNDMQGAACRVTLSNVSVNDAPIRNVTVTVPRGFFQPATGPRGMMRDQESQLLHNQTDLTFVTGTTGGLHNTLVVGMSFAWEDYRLTQASLLRNAAGAAIIPPMIEIANPDTLYTGPINYTETARSRGENRNKAIYLFDNLEIGPMFELNAAVRYENVVGEFRSIPLAFNPPGNTIPSFAVQRSDDDLLSYRFGAVFKPVRSVSLYAGYGNSKTPSSATVRLGCGTIVTGGGGPQDPCAVDPETARNYEVGAKADLFGRRLQLTASVFRNERTNYRVPSNDPIVGALPVLDGRSRVDGIALGASGNIGRNWTVFANYTYLDSEVLQGVSNYCLDNPSTACANTADIRDPQKGSELVQVPKHAGSLFTSYRLPFGLEIGYGLTYQGSFALHAPTANNRMQYRSDDYLIHRAFLSYAFGNGLTAQLNVQNLTNERYFTNIRNNINATSGAITGGWAVPGEDRSAVLSLFYSF
ncbi:TonB-dependent receptor [Allosphingosinicella flava]|uniref:TonB-dependent receptor n=1 Tax=Allosphingosinicella flava TaxID=2771430 RepID=A0A7T2GM05_9SPHN|nr:TonB-dependent receptor [Sphingosinicella flava]QPQ56344.1 TonB-dependent receptor [Sphingosinicella flava]